MLSGSWHSISDAVSLAEETFGPSGLQPRPPVLITFVFGLPRVSIQLQVISPAGC